MNKIDFIEWLQKVMKEEKIKRAGLARASGISAAQITRILNGEQSPGVDTIVSLAGAIRKTPEEVFRRAAGISNKASIEGENKEELLHFYNKLPDVEKKRIVEYIKFTLSEFEKEQGKKK
jgi:transcriptional regulator with XRE-family HTH domain